VAWAAKNFVGEVQQQSKAVVEAAEARGGWEALLNG